jgi:hypothetical protein
MDYKKTALFLDFDNIYIRLKDIDLSMAESFATEPGNWLNWFEQANFGGAGKRRILVRKCFLNPVHFHDFRPYFIRSAFHVIDCPPLTSQGKTSADIHMVMEILAALDHHTRFDEFIIMSGDADFTPLLIKLRENDRRAGILSVGLASPAYKAAASYTIDEDKFIEKGLGFGTQEPVRRLESVPASAKSDIAGFIKDRVARSDEPVSMADLSVDIREAFGNKYDIGSDWLGAGKFGTLLNSLDLGELQIAWTVPGYVYDPRRHTPPEESVAFEEFEHEHPELYGLAHRVHKLTETPGLMPEHYRKIYEAISEEVNENGFSLTTTSKNVRDRCHDMGLPVSRANVNFVLNGVHSSGYDLRDVDRVDPMEVAKNFASHVNDLCQAAQLYLDRDKMNLLIRWLIPFAEREPEEEG